jgi:hypothetical protein
MMMVTTTMTTSLLRIYLKRKRINPTITRRKEALTQSSQIMIPIRMMRRTRIRIRMKR